MDKKRRTESERERGSEGVRKQERSKPRWIFIRVSWRAASVDVCTISQLANTAEINMYLCAWAWVCACLALLLCATHTHTHTPPLQLDSSDQTVLRHRLCTFLKQSTSAGVDAYLCVRACVCVCVCECSPEAGVPQLGGDKRISGLCRASIRRDVDANAAELTVHRGTPPLISGNNP